jgi:hypothetical protein
LYELVPSRVERQLHVQEKVRCRDRSARRVGPQGPRAAGGTLEAQRRSLGHGSSVRPHQALPGTRQR